MRMARPEKVDKVKDISGRFESSEAALLTEYRGLRVSEIAEVRGALRDADAEYKVYKNTLARIAVRDVGLEELAGMLEGPTAIAFVRGDAAAAAKALDDAAKKYPVLVIKGGPIPPELIRRVKAQRDTRFINFFPDNPLWMIPFECIEAYDAFFTKELYAMASLQQVGLRNLHYLPMYCVPSLHHPVALTAEDVRRFASPLSFVGSQHQKGPRTACAHARLLIEQYAQAAIFISLISES